MKAPAHALALFLEAEGLGTFAGDSGWSINAGEEPASPDDTITIYDTPGREPLLYGEPDTGANATYRPAVQVRVRSYDYPGAYDQQEAIRALFHKQTGVDIDNTRVVGIWLTSDIQSLGRDDNNRYRLTANYRLTREEA